MGLSQATGMPRNVFIGKAGAGIRKEGEGGEHTARVKLKLL